MFHFRLLAPFLLIFFACTASFAAEVSRADGTAWTLDGINFLESDRPTAQKEINEKDKAGLLRFDANGLDLYGQPHGLVFEASQTLQEAWVARGLAYVFAANEPLCERLALLEDKARTAKRGLWATPNRVLPSSRAHEALGHYAFLTGTVVYVRERNDSTVFYVGENDKEDFAVVIPRGLGRSLHAQGIVLKRAKGLRIMARGLVEDYDLPIASHLFGVQPSSALDFPAYAYASIS